MAGCVVECVVDEGCQRVVLAFTSPLPGDCLRPAAGDERDTAYLEISRSDSTMSITVFDEIMANEKH